MNNKRKKQNKEEFFEQHPMCCFCGGNQPATTQDHFPGRALFSERKWPEGYIFPACQECNKISSDDELVMAVLTRLGPEKKSDSIREKELASALNRLEHQLPNLRKQFRTFSRTQEKKILLNLNSNNFDGNGNPVRLINVPDEAFERSENFARKLVKALHYKHTNQIIPQTGLATARAFPNAELPKLNHEELTEILGGRPEIIRNTQPLFDQFSYSFGIVEGGIASGYWISLGGGAINFIGTAHLSEERHQAEYQKITNKSPIEFNDLSK